MQNRIDEIVQCFDTLLGIKGYYPRNASIRHPKAWFVRHTTGTYIAPDSVAEFVRLNTS